MCDCRVLQPEGPLALLQAAALFDLTARPRTLVPDDISAAAAALYENRDALKRPSLAPVLGFLAASPLLTSLPDPLGSFLLSLGSLSPLPLARGGGAFARQSSLDILDRIKRQGGAAKGDVSDRGDTERGVPVQRRIQQYLEQWKALSVQPSVCVGSWAFADLAIDLQSLASHMQQCEAEGGHLQERAESSAASPPPSPAAQEEPAQEEPDATDTLEDGGRRQFFTACSQGGPDTSRVLQAANMRQARAEAAHSPSLPSPSCYTWRTDDGLPSASPNINAASHLLVCVLLECFDFVAAPPNSQRLGVHRKREALLCSLTKARLNALRRWGWAVICIREADWRAAEAMDSGGAQAPLDSQAHSRFGKNNDGLEKGVIRALFSPPCPQRARRVNGWMKPAEQKVFQGRGESIYGEVAQRHAELRAGERRDLPLSCLEGIWMSAAALPASFYDLKGSKTQDQWKRGPFPECVSLYYASGVEAGRVGQAAPWEGAAGARDRGRGGAASSRGCRLCREGDSDFSGGNGCGRPVDVCMFG
ncbi:uncharacterized protein LOC113146513 [Cyclospora cayetanensis]|uniref:Uncharacterized protein LOC113146513 n=1 Tax=Cyclospora cayetanensis TaxID=88456 RepID=A0A6P6RRV8_9EIME|nr:uncharacterized protein LOC113146513 [Cyclospora cayetanensis]